VHRQFVLERRHLKEGEQFEHVLRRPVAEVLEVPA
jgi:hypothetical protein